MGRESLWGWLATGVIGSIAAAGTIVVATNQWVLLGGVVLAILSGVAIQVTTIGLGVQVGMARHEYLKGRRG